MGCVCIAFFEHIVDNVSIFIADFEYGLVWDTKSHLRPCQISMMEFLLK